MYEKVPDQVVERLIAQAIVIAREIHDHLGDEGYIIGKLNSFPALDKKSLVIFEKISEVLKEEIGIELSYWAK